MKNQRGGFATGLIVGLLIGLTLALGVALYITKVPIPFMNKVPQRPPEQDAAEAERNRNWDPNAALSGKAASRPAGNAPAATGTVQPAPVLAPVQISPPPAVMAPPKPAEAAVATRSPASAPATAVPPARAAKDPAAILSGGATPAVATAPAVATPQMAPATTPQAATKSTKAGVDPFIYFVQAGAYTRGEDAEQQRANLALLGMAAKVTEREQSGRTVFRVRLGPFEKKEEADAAQEKLQAASIEAALVRVERQ